MDINSLVPLAKEIELNNLKLSGVIDSILDIIDRCEL